MKHRSNIPAQCCCPGDISWERRKKRRTLNNRCLILGTTPFFTL